MLEPTYRDIGSEAEEDLPATSRGRKVIAAIGIDEYAYWPKLHNAVSDAVGMCNLLVEELGFVAPLPPLLNGEATAENILALVQDRLLEVLQPDDSVILFFAGHGHTQVTEEDGERLERGYLIPVEAQTDALAGFIPVHVLLKEASLLPARHSLVILDACRSGLALGRSVVTMASTGGEASEVNDRCRRVITSARWDQPAADSGPVEGHSLFTGYLLQGLNWGTADLFGDGLISSSELGEFLQKRVEQASRSRQKPDSGVFVPGARGDLILSLRGTSNHDLRTRAYAALQRGELAEFRALMQQLAEKGGKVSNPWRVFLDYRRALLDSDVDEASSRVQELRYGFKDLPRGTIPLSHTDLITLDVQITFFGEILSIPESPDFPLDVRLQVGPDDPAFWSEVAPGALPEAHSGLIDSLRVYELVQDSIARFLITNKSDETVHVYFAAVRPDGRLVFGPLLHDPELALHGIEPWAEAEGVPFKVANVGLTETRLLYSPRPMPALLRPPTTATRYLLRPSGTDLGGLRRKSVWYRVIEPS